MRQCVEAAAESCNSQKPSEWMCPQRCDETSIRFDAVCLASFFPLGASGIESHVVDAASIAASRRGRHAKTDRIDAEALVRALLAFKRGEPRVCAMVKVPSPEDEDRRGICRERKVLIAERVEHVDRGQE
ncbi:hypothetical protein GGE07_005644 [Sinorhizobium terangae]|nr:hypothetical protein [Sinorhizobium terangae]